MFAARSPGRLGAGTVSWLKSRQKTVGQVVRGLAVSSGPPREGDGPESAEQALILELSLTAGDPVSGTVGIAGGPPAMSFHGWMDLMSAINTLLAGAGQTLQGLQIAEFPDVNGRGGSLV